MAKMSEIINVSMLPSSYCYWTGCGFYYLPSGDRSLLCWRTHLSRPKSHPDNERC